MRIMFNDVVDDTKKVIYNVSFVYPDVIQDITMDRYVVRFTTLSNEYFVIYSVKEFGVNGLTKDVSDNICRQLLRYGYLDATQYAVFRDVV